MPRNPEWDRQDSIETACDNAMQAIKDYEETARREHCTFDDRLALAAALEAIEHERANLPEKTLPFDVQDCIDHLRKTATPWKQ